MGVYWISTVWLGLDHSFGRSGPPIIFETMVFDQGPEGEAGDVYQGLRTVMDGEEYRPWSELDSMRYETEAEALAWPRRDGGEMEPPPMRPTWLERRRMLFLTQALCNLPIQVAIYVTFSFWFGPYELYGLVFNFAFVLWGALALGLWAVGYRRYRHRMRMVALALAVNGHSREDLWDLLTNDIIDYADYATFARYFLET